LGGPGGGRALGWCPVSVVVSGQLLRRLGVGEVGFYLGEAGFDFFEVFLVLGAVALILFFHGLELLLEFLEIGGAIFFLGFFLDGFELVGGGFEVGFAGDLLMFEVLVAFLEGFDVLGFFNRHG